MLRPYEQTQHEQDLLLAENETYNEQWRAYSLTLLHKNEKLKGKRNREVAGIKRLHKLATNWRVDSCKHLSHISMLKKKLKAR